MAPKKSKKAPGSAGSRKKGKARKTRSPTPVQKPDYPDHVFPLVLTAATQAIFNCRADEDLTKDNPFKMLQISDIMQDIKTRAGVSDFSPAKQLVLDYPEDEMLLVFDRDLTYGQCFYLALTPEAIEAIMRPPEPDTQEEEEEEFKTPEPVPWVSLGSEQEIEEESVKESRAKLQYKFSRVRRKFGAPICFSDRNAADNKESLLECPSYKDSRFSIKQLLRDCGTQAVPRLQSSGAQTEWNSKKNMFTQYKPRQLSETEKEDILQSESVKNFCDTVLPRMLHALQQEEIANVFSDDFKVAGAGDEASDWSGKISEGLVLYQIFTDPKYTKTKIITCVNWHPTIHGMIAVSVKEKKEEEPEEFTTLAVRSAFIVLYTFSDPCNSQVLLECPDDIISFDFCPSDPSVIVGGCVNGQVVLWDYSAYITFLQRAQANEKKHYVSTDTFDSGRHKESKTPVVRYCAVSALDSNHKAPITDVQWLPETFEVTRMGVPVENKQRRSVQLITCSPECTLMFWDLRASKPGYQPPAADKKDNVDQKISMTQYFVSDKFKHLDRSWKPLLKLSLPKIGNGAEYAPLKFSIEQYGGNENTDKLSEDESSEVSAVYSQLRALSAKTVTPLQDVSTKIYVGTEDGEIVYADWKLVREETGRLTSSQPLFSFRTHQWLVNTIQRSPFFKDIILTTGGWNFAIWKEDVLEGPIIVSPTYEQECSVGCWSLSRPAIFFIGKNDGTIEVWNILENSSEPSHVNAHITSGKITCIKPWIVSSRQHFLAVSDDLGMLRVFEIRRNLYIPTKKESVKVKNYFDMESERLLDYLKRDERWVKERKEAAELKKKMKPQELQEPEKPEKPEQLEQESQQKKERLKKHYEEYQQLEEHILQTVAHEPATENTQGE